MLFQFFLEYSNVRFKLFKQLANFYLKIREKTDFYESNPNSLLASSEKSGKTLYSL